LLTLGREEKKIPAHEGAVIMLKWSHDGNALCTAGEDGDVKIWSKNGNLRSTLVSLGQSIYTIAWAPDDDHIVCGHGKTLMIKSIQSNKKNLTWNAHEGIILCVDWNISNNLLVSGAEDCCYKVWDLYGRLLYSSKPLEHFVTSVAWCPNGNYFAIGSYNLIKLCDKVGWTYSKAHTTSGSIYNISFTYDNTSLAAACGNNSVLFAHIIERKYEYKHWEVTLLNANKIRIYDTNSDNFDEVDITSDHIVDLCCAYDILLVSTRTQCYIYSLGNINTPIIFPIKTSTQFIHMANQTTFLLCDYMQGLQIYNIEGKCLSSPRFPNFRSELYIKEYVCLSHDVCMVIDCVDMKHIHVFDANTSRNYGKITHTQDVCKIYCNQSHATPHARLLAFIDKLHDLYIVQLNTTMLSTPNLNAHVQLHKLSSHVESVLFHDVYNTLVCISDQNLLIYYHPEVVFIHKDLLPYTCAIQHNHEYGRNAQFIAYSNNRVSVRKIDGSVMYANTAVDVPLLGKPSPLQGWMSCV
jgi:intraflagellar transport protein 80